MHPVTIALASECDASCHVCMLCPVVLAHRTMFVCYSHLSGTLTHLRACWSVAAANALPR